MKEAENRASHQRTKLCRIEVRKKSTTLGFGFRAHTPNDSEYFSGGMVTDHCPNRDDQIKKNVIGVLSAASRTEPVTTTNCCHNKER
jgi:hypothetical protein